MYDFNLLVSCPWIMIWRAKREIVDILKLLGDENPIIKPTIARGIIGVKTRLDSREVVQGLQKLFIKDPIAFQYTLKWVPTDFWTYSDMDSMKEAVMNIKEKIHERERWRMTVEKRRYTRYHKIEIIKETAELIQEKVDLENPDKILRIDIIGKYAAVSVLLPNETFSTTKLPTEERET
jgi:tRNA acetyltransferase TAN1